MITKSLNDVVKELILFRRNMKCELTLSKARYIWGRKAIHGLSKEVSSSLSKQSSKGMDISETKLSIAKRNLDNLLVFDWVKFIGVSGSIAAGFAKEEDDIDLFIVVRDGCAWIYRGILTLRNIFNHTNRTKRDGKSVKDLFCVNYIVEERGLNIESDLFNMHELMYIIPLYNPSYLKYVYKQNSWLMEEYGVNKNLSVTRIQKSERVNIIVRIINICAYIAQILFMFIVGHKPELSRLKENYKEGRIEFYSKGFKKEVLRKLDTI